jgi:hypothetical protein
MSVSRREYLSNDVKVVLSSHRGLLQRHARLCSSASALSSQDCMSMSRNIVEAVAYGKGRPHFFRGRSGQPSPLGQGRRHSPPLRR